MKHPHYESAGFGVSYGWCSAGEQQVSPALMSALTGACMLAWRIGLDDVEIPPEQKDANVGCVFKTQHDVRPGFSTSLPSSIDATLADREIYRNASM